MTTQQCEELALCVFESDDSRLVFKLFKKQDAKVSPYDLTGAVINFIVKTNASDAAALFTYASPTAITIDSTTGGVFTVNFTGTDIATPGIYRYRIRVQQNSKWRTVGYGPLEVINV